MSSEIIRLSKPERLNMGQEWFEHANEKHFWFQWRIDAAIKQIENAGIDTMAPLKVIDIGGGLGVLSSQIEERTEWIVDVCDLNEQALTNSKSTKGKKFLYNILDKNTSLLEKYDIVVLYDVIEHIKNTKEFINSSCSHLKSNGLILVNAPALHIFYSVYDEAMGHYRRYNKKTLLNEFKDEQLVLLDLRYWGFLLLPILFLRTVLVNRISSKPKIIKTGFAPNTISNFFLKVISKIELLMCSKPLIGTSLLAIMKKI